MPEPNSAQSKADHSQSDQAARVPLTARLLLRESLTARRAAAIIAGFTVLITVGGGILEWVVEMNVRLARIEAALRSPRSGGPSDGVI